MKKIIAIALGIIVILASTFVGARYLSADAAQTIAENDEVKKSIEERLRREGKLIESDTHESALEDVPSEGESKTESNASNAQSDTSGNEDMLPEETDAAVDAEANSDENATVDTNGDSDVTSAQNQTTDSPLKYEIHAFGDNLGTTKVVGGRAFVMLDDDNVHVWQGEVTKDMLDDSKAPSDKATGQYEAWGFYCDQSMKQYQFAGTENTIPEFAFSRSGLTSVHIPSSVTSIGYAAFYHCDQLEVVEIPDSVTEIGAHAFDHTPWMDRFLSDASREWLIVGDGILIAYKGDTKPTALPKEVKKVADGVFDK